MTFAARRPEHSASLCRGGPARIAGAWEEALRMNDGVLAMYTAAYGPGSLSGAYGLNNRGYYLNDLERPAEALVAFQDALRRGSRTSGRTTRPSPIP